MKRKKQKCPEPSPRPNNQYLPALDATRYSTRMDLTRTLPVKHVRKFIVMDASPRTESSKSKYLPVVCFFMWWRPRFQIVVRAIFNVEPYCDPNGVFCCTTQIAASALAVAWPVGTKIRKKKRSKQRPKQQRRTERTQPCPVIIIAHS